MDPIPTGPPDVTTDSDAEQLLSSAGFDVDDAWLKRIREAESTVSFGTLGPYHLLAEVGRGGQGIVYKAIRPGASSPIALKRLLAGSLATPQMTRRLQREIEALVALNHPHIVAILDVEQVDGVPVLAMEWVDGTPITQWADAEEGAGRSVAERVRMCLRVCDAVQHAHQRGIIHRDLKPSNILIDKQDEAHILDFGLAKLTSLDETAAPSVTTSDQFVGTLCYASPEQLSGSSQQIDVRSDIYALGVILYEMLTRRLPYPKQDGWAEMSRQIEQAPPPRPSGLVNGIDRDLEAIVLKAMNRDINARYQSCDALAQDLRSFLSGNAVGARLPGSFAQLWRAMWRHRVAVSFALTVFGLVVMFAAIAATLALRIAEQRDLALAAQMRERHARTRTEQEARRAEAISGFLQHMLASPEAIWPHTHEVTVREALDAAALRVGTKFSGPDQASVRVILAQMYQDLGLEAPAEKQLRAALSLYENAYGRRHPDVVVTLTRLATLLHAQGDNQAAGHVTRRAVTLYREVLEDGHPLLNVELTGMAAHFFMNGDPREAEELYRRTLEAHIDMFGEHHEAVADDLAGLASFLSRLDQCAEACEFGRKGIDIRRSLVGHEHPELATDLFNMGSIYNLCHQRKNAVLMFRQALAMRRKLFDQNHPIIADTVYALGSTLSNTDQHHEAEALLKEALELCRISYGEDHRFMAFRRQALGKFLHERGKHQRALPLLEAAFRIFRGELSEDHLRTAQVANDLGACLTRCRRFAEAEPLLLKSFHIITSKLGSDHEDTQQAIRNLLELYQAWGKPQQVAQWQSLL